LIVNVNYSPEKKKVFSPAEIEKLVLRIRNKCDSFEAQLPENIKCEVTFKNFEEKIYKIGQSDFELESRELEELQVTYRFCVEYYV
jgi:hypothetical protein